MKSIGEQAGDLVARLKKARNVEEYGGIVDDFFKSMEVPSDPKKAEKFKEDFMLEVIGQLVPQKEERDLLSPVLGFFLEKPLMAVEGAVVPMVAVMQGVEKAKKLQDSFNRITGANQDWKAWLVGAAALFGSAVLPIGFLIAGPLGAPVGFAISSVFITAIGFSKWVNGMYRMFRGIPTEKREKAVLEFITEVIGNLPNNEHSPKVAMAVVAAAQRALTGTNKYRIRTAALKALKANTVLSEVRRKEVEKSILAVTPSFLTRVFNMLSGSNKGGRGAPNLGLGLE